MQNTKFMVRLPKSLSNLIDIKVEAKKEKLLKETIPTKISKMQWLTATPAGKDLLVKVQSGRIQFATSRELNQHIADEYCRANGVKPGAGRPRRNFLPPDHLIRDEVIAELLTQALEG